jgi:hypothetical protein
MQTSVKKIIAFVLGIRRLPDIVRYCFGHQSSVRNGGLLLQLQNYQQNWTRQGWHRTELKYMVEL